MEGVQVVRNSQCSVAFRKQYSLQVLISMRPKIENYAKLYMENKAINYVAA